ncbi:MAG TPA: MIP/aquaporin family protein [Vicinamibacterales bacterium]|nr:MIP/aquaporin family protein [Vicinamibacterales bacterium]
MASPVLGELVGTLVLILLGNGVVAGVLLKKSKGENAGWLAITTGWAFAVFAGVFTAIACGSSDAHLNPAVTLGFAVASGDFTKVVPYVLAQLVGAFIGAMIVWVHYAPHWQLTRDPDLKLGTFCTIPAVRHVPSNLASEIIGTFVLVLVVAAIFSKRVAATGLAAGVGPYLVGSLVWGIGLSLGGTTGYAINPARDLGPRIAHAILPIPAKRDADWGYAPIPVIGPLVGGALAGLFARLVGM